jgi:hypothetical protein
MRLKYHVTFPAKKVVQSSIRRQPVSRAPHAARIKRPQSGRTFTALAPHRVQTNLSQGMTNKKAGTATLPKIAR